MRKLAIAMVASGAMGSAGMVNALGLGEITMHSTLNQPLNAEVELLNVRDLDAWEIKPALASGAEFDKAGVERFYFLTDLSFKVTISEDGKAFVTIKSKKPVIEPFVNFLVEVNWPSGRLLREYTLLLDPPVFSEEQPPVLETDAALAPEPYAEVSESEPVVVTTAAVTGLQAEPGTYVVGESDTLWEVALRVRPGKQVSPQQTMLALQDLNSRAFLHGNINLLKQHQVLRVPTLEQIQQRGKSAAINEVVQQNKAFANKDFSKPVASAQIDARKRAPEDAVETEGETTGELKLLASAEKEGTASGEVDDDRFELENELAISLEMLDKNNRENEELQTRMVSLEEQLETLQRLISLKDDQLAALQSGVTEDVVEAGLEAVTEEVAAEEALPEEIAAEEAVVDEAAVEAVDEAAAVEEIAESTGEVAPEDAVEDLNFQSDTLESEAVESEVVDAAPVVTPVTPVADTGLMGMAQQYMWQIAAGLGALILALAALAMRKRKEPEVIGDDLAEMEEFEEFDEGLDEFEEENLDELSLDEFDESLEDESISVGDFASEDVLEEEQTVAQTSDALSEADIYIAYGRFDQAIELLNNAVASEPERTDLRLKLMEVFVETNDAQGFAEQEAHLSGEGDAVLTQVNDFKSRLSVPLVAEEVADAAPEVSLDVELEEVPELDDALLLDEEVDFNLDDADLGLDLETTAEVPTLDDLSADLELTDSTEEVPVLDDLELDVGTEADEDSLDMGSLDLASIDEGFDLESSAEESLDMDFDAVLGDVEAEEELDIDVSDMLDEAIDVAGESEEAPQVAEDDLSELSAELDDISMDLNAEELPAGIEVDDLESLGAELDDISLDMDADVTADLDTDLTADLDADLDADLSAGVDDLASLGDELDTLGAELDDLDTLGAELDELVEEVDEEMSAVVEDVELEAEPDVSGDIESLVSAVTESGPEQADDTFGDMDLSDLVDSDDEGFEFLSGTDEAETKLDLARAYIDMDDRDGAREILEEVVKDGSEKQQQDAKALLDSI